LELVDDAGVEVPGVVPHCIGDLGDGDVGYCSDYRIEEIESSLVDLTL
jgi:hypothetical protein